METRTPEVSHAIASLHVILPRPGRSDRHGLSDDWYYATRVFEVGDRLAVASAHSEGFWVLPVGFDPFAPRSATRDPVVADWIAHPDARFSVSRRW